MDEFSKIKPDEFKIILLDNGAFHKSINLIIPINIALLFIPPYSPELNPSEKIWWRMKRAFSGKLHKSLDEVSDFIIKEVNQLTNQIVKNTCNFEYFFLAQFWTNLY